MPSALHTGFLGGGSQEEVVYILEQGHSRVLGLEVSQVLVESLVEESG